MYEPYVYQLLQLPESQTDPTYYDLLGLEPGPVKPEVVTRALEETRTRMRANIPHPQFIPMCAVVEQELEKAAAVLADPKRKAEYDREIAAEPEPDPKNVKRQALTLLRKELGSEGTLPGRRRKELAARFIEMGLPEEEVRAIFSRIPATEVKQDVRLARKFLKRSVKLAVEREGPELSDKTMAALRQTARNVALPEAAIEDVIKKVVRKANEKSAGQKKPAEAAEDEVPPPLPPAPSKPSTQPAQPARQQAQQPAAQSQAAAQQQYNEPQYVRQQVYEQPTYEEPSDPLGGSDYDAAALLRQRGRSSGGNKTLIIIAVVVVLLGVGAVVLYVNSRETRDKKKKEDDQTTAQAAPVPAKPPARKQPRRVASNAPATGGKTATDVARRGGPEIAVGLPDIDGLLKALAYQSTRVANKPVTSEAVVAQHLRTSARMDMANALMVWKLAGRKTPGLQQSPVRLLARLDNLVQKSDQPTPPPTLPPEVMALMRGEDQAVPVDTIKPLLEGSPQEVRLAMALLPKQPPRELEEAIAEQLKRGRPDTKLVILHGLGHLEEAAAGRLLSVGLSSTISDVAHLASVELHKKFPDTRFDDTKLPLRNGSDERKACQVAWSTILDYKTASGGSPVGRHMSTGILQRPVKTTAEPEVPPEMQPYRLPYGLLKYLSLEIGLVQLMTEGFGALAAGTSDGTAFSLEPMPVVREQALWQWSGDSAALVRALITVLQSQPKAGDLTVAVDEIRSRAEACRLTARNELQKVAVNYEAAGDLLKLLAGAMDEAGSMKKLVTQVEEAYSREDAAAADVLNQIRVRALRNARLLAICCKLKAG